jgi:hypothetical protein
MASQPALNALEHWYSHPYHSLLQLLHTVSGGMRGQFTKIRLTIVIASLLGATGIFTTYLISAVADVPLGDLTRDPAAINNTRFYYGLLTYVNIVCWAAATAVCLLGAILIGKSAETRKMRLFLIAGSALNLILLADDTLMLHEHVFPVLVGIPEFIVYGVYGLMLLGYLVYFLPQILQSEYLLLGAALLFLGVSIGIDKVFHSSELVTFIEDSTKLLGIIFWLTFFARYTVNSVQARFVK